MENDKKTELLKKDSTITRIEKRPDQENAEKEENEVILKTIKVGTKETKFGNNKIQTKKYSLFTFIPLNFFEQTSKPANMYFLFLAVLQIIPDVSITKETPTILLPLFFIYFLTAIKDLFEDYKRYQSDTKENKNKFLILENFRFVEKESQSIFCGDIIKLKNQESIPADCIILDSTNKKKCAYVETKNLDGETNLKLKEIVNIKQNSENEIDKLTKFQKANICYEKENCNLEEFKGILKIDDKEIEVSEKNLLLRGCVLKNTKEIIGVVVYTGHQTKMMLNSVKAKGKKSSLDKETGYFVYITFLIQMAFCSFASIYYIIILNIWKNNFKNWMDFKTSDLFLIFVKKFGNWTLIFSNFIPISLLITLESIKFFQSIRISMDECMQIEETNSKGEIEKINCTVQNSSLNEELGQVNHIFTDKTGTLTENKMLFSGLIINDEIFCQSHKNKDQAFIDALSKTDSKANLIKENLKCLGLCHSILFDENNNANSASSEEIAFYNFLKDYNYIYAGQKHENNSPQILSELIEDGVKKNYKFLEVIEFSSLRKKMSVIVEDDKGDIFLYTKGADDVLKALLNLGSKEKKNNLTKLEKKIENAAMSGFRVMMLVYRKLEKNYFENWNSEYSKLKKKFDKKSKERMVELQKEIENDFELLGGGILEDKLQEGVTETIEFITRANIKIWMITGDKTQTAISVGRNAGMIAKYDQIIILDDPSKISKKTLDELNHLYNDDLSFFSIIMSGKFLTELLSFRVENKNLYTFFLNFLLKPNTVIFSRASPKQKQEIVQMVKDHDKNKITLAIGDGANDVNMITCANVGIGLKSSEGKQASRASDFHFAKFKFLQPLLFYYGRENYRKNSVVVLYMFYKNFMLVMPQFWFGFFNFFSGQTLYEAFSYQLYNTVSTFLPIFLYGIFDKTLPKSEFMTNPKLYKVGLKNIYFNVKVYFSFIGSAMIISFFICFSSMSIFGIGTSKDGHAFGLWNFGNMCLLAIILIVNLKLLAISNSYSILSIVFFALSIFSFYLFWFIFSLFVSNDLYTTFIELICYPEFYLFHFVVFAISLFEYYLEKIITVIFTQKYKLVDQRPTVLRKRRSLLKNIE